MKPSKMLELVENLKVGERVVIEQFEDHLFIEKKLGNRIPSEWIPAPENIEEMDKEKASETQIGGNHYSNMVIQPIEFIHKNNLSFIQGNIIKYVCRYKSKGGIEDLNKAKHYIDLLIEFEEKNN